MLVQNQIGEGLAMPTDPQHTPTFIQPSPPPQKTQKPRKPKRKDTQVPQPSGPTDIVADEAVHKELGDSLVRAATTASSLEAEQDSGNITKTRSKETPNESISLGTTSGAGPRGNTLRSDKDSLKLKELMELCTYLQTRVLDLEKTKTTQQIEIDSLKRRVKKLEKKRSSKSYKQKRLYKVGLSAKVESSSDEEDLGEDASKQGRRINAIDADKEITLVNVQNDADNEIFNVDALTGDEVFVAEQEVAAKDVKGDVIKEPSVPVSATSAPIKVSVATTTTTTIPTPRKGIIIIELGTPTTTISLQQSHDKAEFDEEERLAREKTEKEKEANIALTEEWDDIQAKIEADHELAQRMQAEEQEELSDAEKATLFQQLLVKRRKHFAAKRAKEQRNKPPTQAQQRKIMCAYLKNMEGKKPKDLKNKSFDSIQKMFDRAFKKVNTFFDFRTDLVEGSSKRVGEELEQESIKKQNVDEDKDTTELQSLMEVTLDEEEVAIDVVPLAIKSSSIVGWKIHKEGKKIYYKIMKADRKSQMYRIFSHMLKSFSREDLEDLYKLVKVKYESTRPVEDLDLLLWGNLKTITFLEDTICVHLHVGRKEISSYTIYNYIYAEQEASVNAAERVNAASEEVSIAKYSRFVLWFCLDMFGSKHMMGDRALLRNFVEKFMGTVRFGNDNFAAITSYGDYIHGHITICHVYYVEGLRHNLISGWTNFLRDLEVAFRSKICYVRNLEGDDLLTGGRDSNLYTISISDMAASSPICLMSKATSTKSWLWHRRLSHLNFGTINDLTKLDLVDGLPKFKYGKDHLCSACERGKSKKASHPPKLIPSDYSKLELLHMDLCDPMRVVSVNEKKYILVIVDDFSRFTRVYFLRSKDETPEIIKKFIA
ncbi:uncharacterized mitochondrial protein-like protein [Tanacetum coccineum]